LTHLTLHTEIFVGASSGLSFHALHFPHLCTLSLRKLVFEPSVGVEHFILRHAATLSRLELIMCGLPIDPDTEMLIYSSRSRSTTLTRDKSGLEPLHWERIWDNFAADLTALIALHVNESETRTCILPVRHRYVAPVPEYRMFAVESRDAPDAEALRRFYMTIAARRRRAGYPEVEAASGISVKQWQTVTKDW